MKGLFGLLLALCLVTPAHTATSISADYDTFDGLVYTVGTGWGTWIYTGSTIEIQLEAAGHYQFQTVANMTHDGTASYNGNGAMYAWADNYNPCFMSRRYRITSLYVQFMPYYATTSVTAYSEWSYSWWME